MNPDDITRILDELGNRLGPAGQHAFELAVRYKVTDAIVGIGFWAGLAVLAAIGLRKLWTKEFDDPMDRDLARAVGSLLGGIGVLAGAAFVCMNIVTLLNPEYAALRDIVGALR